MIPSNITKEHFLNAIREIDEKGVRKGRDSTTYDLLHEGKAYPPKLVMSLANKYANREELNPESFVAGMNHGAFRLMIREGFEIIRKNDPVKILIKKYKAHIADSLMKDEIYKWELVGENLGQPDTNAEDFEEEIKQLKFKNMIYHLGPAVLKELARENPEGF